MDYHWLLEAAMLELNSLASSEKEENILVSIKKWATIGQSEKRQWVRGALAGQLCADVWTNNDVKGYFLQAGQVRSAVIV